MTGNLEDGQQPVHPGDPAAPAAPAAASRRDGNDLDDHPARTPSTVLSPSAARRRRVVTDVVQSPPDGPDRLTLTPIHPEGTFRSEEDQEPPASRPRSDVDGWGRSERVRTVVRRLYDPIYRHWFRVEWEGIEHVPMRGGALLVANHSGAIPPDAPAVMHGIEEELGRPIYGMADFFFRTVPVVGTVWSRAGGVPAHPDNAYRLLHDEHQLALVFPEGSKGPSKTYADRYRLRRFGRGGFVEIAMRAGVPVVPLAIVGAEEAMPILFRIPVLSRALRVPYFPVTANVLLLGPLLGAVTYFPAKIRIRVLEPTVFDVDPGLEHYSKSRVMDEAERIRGRIQDALHDMLRDRRSVWFG